MQRLVVMAKRPRPGRVKTRLARAVGEAAALTLYRAFLEDTLALAAGAIADRAELELCYDGAPGADDPRPDGPHLQSEQGPGDLGERLARALARGRAAGVERLVFIGADAPSLSGSTLDAAFARLGEVDVALAPADDGGYVLIGVAGDHPGIFSGIPWSSAAVAGATRARAAELGLRLAELPAGFDVDDRRSLARLRSLLADDPGLAPASARALARIDDSGGPVV